MLNKDVFFNKMDELVMTYANWRLKYDDVKTMKFWYDKFKDFEDERFIQMVDKYLANEKFNPTIAGLREWDIMPRKSATQIAHEKSLAEHKAEKEKENART